MMTDPTEKIIELQRRFENLAKYQNYFNEEIAKLQTEILNLKNALQYQTKVGNESAEPVQTQPAPVTQGPRPSIQSQASQARPNSPPIPASVIPETNQIKANLEKFIGENLISKIGIIILVLGVAVGAKYAIDHDLISPLTRIILGYLVGIGLLGFAIRLKPKYLNFSAVLLSGAMAIMYFLTFAAYGFYGLIPQGLAFGLMLFFTMFTVIAAINYNRQVIAHIGLVGAYTIPFLLSDDSGRYAVLLSYISLINLGILVVSIRKYWKPLFYSSFIISWLIFIAWYAGKYKTAEHFGLGLTFATIFFLTFYITFLAYKLFAKEKFGLENVALLLANSFIYYGLGYSMLESNAAWESYIGPFTVVNSFIHFVIGTVIYRYTSADGNVVKLIIGLVLVFLTIAIPVQLDGNWVTLLWTGEAALLFSLGRTKGSSLYEYFSYPLMVLASISLLQDWTMASSLFGIREIQVSYMPVFNVIFLTGILFVTAFSGIYYLNKHYPPSVHQNWYKILSAVIPVVLLFVLYNTLRLEIGRYWHNQHEATILITTSGQITDYSRPYGDSNLLIFNIIWQINYTLLFFNILSVVNLKKFQSAALGIANLIFNALTLSVFLTGGLYCLSLLRDSYLHQTNAQYFDRTSFNLYLRYICFAFAFGLIFASYKHIKANFMTRIIPTKILEIALDFVLFTSLLIIVSSELINWMDIFKYNDSYKLGLSILWGVYAALLVGLGINKHKKHLRIGAIALFALTLGKLFLYDISDLNTISKTIVFVSLGVLLLIISFLYTKYRNLIFDENES